jgi:hypothetical protein
MSRGQKRAFRKIRFNSRVFWLFSVCTAIALSVFYVVQINSEVSAKYAIDSYQKKENLLSRENKSLEISLGQTMPLEKLAQTIGELGFEKIEKIYYVRALDNRVVTTLNEKLAD